MSTMASHDDALSREIPGIIHRVATQMESESPGFVARIFKNGFGRLYFTGQKQNQGQQNDTQVFDRRVS